MTTTVLEPAIRETPLPVEQEWPPQNQWTYEAYRRLPDDGWIYEVIEGELHLSPPPIPIHQENA